jgi:hypothetical protein
MKNELNTMLDGEITKAYFFQAKDLEIPLGDNALLCWQ